MSNDSIVQIGLQLHRGHDHGLFPAYFEYLPSQENLKGSATFVTYQFGSMRGINCTYHIGSPLSVNTQPGDQCSITLKVEHPGQPVGEVSRHLVRFTYRGPDLIDIETEGIDLRIYPEPPLVDTMVEAFEAYVALYQRTHPEIGAPWYHGADEQVLNFYRRDPLMVRFGWLLGSTCNVRFFGEEDFELEIIEHCLCPGRTPLTGGREN